ncbi:hypothetical protein BH09BAC3_BH09BAC3_35980 [soil metagenome]
MKNILKYALVALSSVCLFSCDKHEKRQEKYPSGQIMEEFKVLKTDEGSFIRDGSYDQSCL